MEKLLKKLNIEYYTMRNLYYCLTLHSLKIIYFAYFQSLLQFRIIFWGTTINLSKALILQKRIMRVILGLRQRTSCREKFKKLHVLTVPNLYRLILEMVMFVIKNTEKYQTNDSIHSKDMRQIKTNFIYNQ